jgi:hypothetical protein
MFLLATCFMRVSYLGLFFAPEVGGDTFLWQISLLHSVTSQKTGLIIIAAVSTSVIHPLHSVTSQKTGLIIVADVSTSVIHPGKSTAKSIGNTR